MTRLNRKNIIIRLAAVIMLGICAAAGCARNAEQNTRIDPYTIGVVTKSRDSEYWMSVCSGMEKAAKDYGVSVKIVSPDSESNDKMQKKMIHDLIQEEVDALAISPIALSDTSYLEEAAKKTSGRYQKCSGSSIQLPV